LVVDKTGVDKVNSNYDLLSPTWTSSDKFEWINSYGQTRNPKVETSLNPRHLRNLLLEGVVLAVYITPYARSDMAFSAFRVLSPMLTAVNPHLLNF